MSNEESDLFKLDGLVLADLEQLDDSALAHALRRVIADADEFDDPIALFESFI
ncbi:MAG: FxSxx-COOH protein [Actinomycetota bacterium]|nr:FxSxx-COOH protein [Actinomycetota bacterium]